MRRGLALFVLVGAALVAAPAAQAGTAAMPAGSFYGFGSYRALPGETNTVVVRGLTQSSFVVADPGGAPIEAQSNGFGGTCRSLVVAAECVLGAGLVVEETAIVTGPSLHNPFNGYEINVSLDDGDDTATTIDGFETFVDCGPGADVAVIEAGDATESCETVHRL